MTHHLRIQSIVTAAIAAACFGSMTFAADQPVPNDQPPPPAQRDHAATQDITGTLQSFNYGPRGNVESVNLTVDGKLAQINLPPELASAFAQSVSPGDSIKATVCPDNGPPGPPRGGPQEDNAGPPAARTSDHPLYRVVTLTNGKGKEYRASAPGDRKAVRIEGAVKSLNYDRRGMVNGVQLDSGDLVRIGPREAMLFDLAPGKKLTVDGVAEPLPTGGQSIDANTVNGILVKTTLPNAAGPRGGPDAQGSPREPGGPQGPDDRGPGGPPDGPPNAAPQ